MTEALPGFLSSIRNDPVDDVENPFVLCDFILTESSVFMARIVDQFLAELGEFQLEVGLALTKHVQSGLFLLRHRPLDDDLAGPHVDFDVVGMPATASANEFQLTEGRLKSRSSPAAAVAQLPVRLGLSGRIPMQISC